MPFVCIFHRKKKYDCCVSLDFCAAMKSRLCVSELGLNVMSFVGDGSSAPSTTAGHVFHSCGYCGVCLEVLGSDHAELLSAATLRLDCERGTNYPGIVNGLF